MPINVLIDTSILLISIKKRLDIFEEITRLLRGNIEFLIPSQVKLELQRISLKQTSLGFRATRALEIIKKYKIICIENNSKEENRE